MSHVVTCKVEMKNRDALNAAIDHLGLENLGQGNHRLYGRSVDGVGLKLPDWNYPVVINPETGEAFYDNYGGSWGKQLELDKLVQRYSIEVAEAQAMESGYNVETVDQENGDVELIMTQLASS